VPSRYENISITQPNLDVPYENISVQPSSPRTRIRTVAIVPRDPAPLPPPTPEVCDKETKPETHWIQPGLCTSTPTENQGITVVEKPLIHSEPKELSEWGTPVRSAPISNGTNLYQEKFILPLEENGSNGVQDDSVQVEVLQKEISKIVSALSVLKGRVTDINQQEEELKREVEMEKALVEGELSAQSLKLQGDEARLTALKKQIAELDADMAEGQERDIRRVAETKEALEKAELEAARLEKELEEAQGDPERRSRVRELLSRQHDVVDTERKQFEDIEFRQLEEEAGWLAKREELQRELSEATAKYAGRQERVQQLEEQVKATGDSADGERRVLEAQKVAYVRRIEQVSGARKVCVASDATSFYTMLLPLRL